MLFDRLYASDADRRFNGGDVSRVRHHCHSEKQYRHRPPNAYGPEYGAVVVLSNLSEASQNHRHNALQRAPNPQQVSDHCYRGASRAQQRCGDQAKCGVVGCVCICLFKKTSEQKTETGCDQRHADKEDQHQAEDLDHHDPAGEPARKLPSVCDAAKRGDAGKHGPHGSNPSEADLHPGSDFVSCDGFLHAATIAALWLGSI